MSKNNDQTKLVEADARKKAIAEQLSELTLAPMASSGIEPTHANAVKLPLGQLASLDTLSAILADYRYNWDNPQFKQAKYNLVQEINRDARQHIIELRTHLTQKAQKKSVIELRSKTGNTAEATVEVLKDYQLAVYLYSFSTFLGVMLLENYDQAYLQSKADDARAKSIEYRQAYTDCFNAIESRGEKAADSLLLGGASSGLRVLGHLVEKTPIGARTLINEALIDAVAGIGDFNEKKTNEIAFIRQSHGKPLALENLVQIWYILIGGFLATSKCRGKSPGDFFT